MGSFDIILSKALVPDAFPPQGAPMHIDVYFIFYIYEESQYNYLIILNFYKNILDPGSSFRSNKIVSISAEISINLLFSKFFGRIYNRNQL